jgi:Secretion system C-terminal sorting domain
MKKVNTLLFLFAFAHFTTFAQLSETLTSGSLPSGWTSSSPTDVTFSTASGGYANFVTNGATLTTPTINVPVGSTIKFDVAKFGSGTDGPITATINNGSTTQVITSGIPTSSTYIIGSPVTITATGPNVTITFSRASSPSQKRLRNIVVVSPPLEVNLKNLFSIKLNNSNKLTWQTTSEKNNAYFNIERSNDGDVFSKIGQVKGSGTSTVTQNYQFTDATPVKGINYYRLRQVDFDGTETVSKTLSVNFDGKGQNKVKVYPTLVKDNVNVELSTDTKSEIAVRDLTGRVIMTQNNEGVSNATLNLGALSSGLYILSVRSNEGLESVKIYKQ